LAASGDNPRVALIVAALAVQLRKRMYGVIAFPLSAIVNGMEKRTAAALIVAGICWLAPPPALDAQEEDLFLAILTMVEEDVERHGTHELFQMDGPWFIDVDSFLDNLVEHQPEVRFRRELLEQKFGVSVRASDREHAWECVGRLCKVRDYGILVEVHEAQPLVAGIAVDVIYDFTRSFGSRDQPGIYRRVLRGCVERTPQGWTIAEFGGAMAGW